jgi:hypothetical protein
MTPWSPPDVELRWSMIRRRLDGHRIHRHTSCKNLDVQSAVDLLWYDKRRGVIVVTPSLGLFGRGRAGSVEAYLV